MPAIDAQRRIPRIRPARREAGPPGQTPAASHRRPLTSRRQLDEPPAARVGVSIGKWPPATPTTALGDAGVKRKSRSLVVPEPVGTSRHGRRQNSMNRPTDRTRALAGRQRPDRRHGEKTSLWRRAPALIGPGARISAIALLAGCGTTTPARPALRLGSWARAHQAAPPGAPQRCQSCEAALGDDATAQHRLVQRPHDARRRGSPACACPSRRQRRCQSAVAKIAQRLIVAVHERWSVPALGSD
jgi:hypothetical protein